MPEISALKPAILALLTTPMMEMMCTSKLNFMSYCTIEAGKKKVQAFRKSPVIKEDMGENNLVVRLWGGGVGGYTVLYIARKKYIALSVPNTIRITCSQLKTNIYFFYSLNFFSR